MKKVNKRRRSAVSSIAETHDDELRKETTSTEDFSLEPSPDAEQESWSTEQSEPPPVQQLGRIQQYWINTMKIFADCAVQKSQEGVFDVLARNFETSGALSWWLWRIGHGEKCRFTKRRDIVDAIRKVSAELHKDLSQDIGQPVARW